jgi:hypothetical protein
MPGGVMKLILRRTHVTPDGVFGKLYVPGSDPLYTCEDDDCGNLRGKCCIPAGVYTLKRTTYHKYGIPTFEVTNVPGRSRILIHAGNSEEDTQGCILVGLSRGPILVQDEDHPDKPWVRKIGVLDSRLAFRRFMVQMAAVETAELTIEWANTPTLKAA